MIASRMMPQDRAELGERMRKGNDDEDSAFGIDLRDGACRFARAGFRAIDASNSRDILSRRRASLGTRWSALSGSSELFCAWRAGLRGLLQDLSNRRLRARRGQDVELLLQLVG
jgi:hypothetical protein